MTGMKELETALFHAHVSRCVSYAGVCLLVYDHFLTFADEVRLVWSRPTNVISIFYLINRYTTPLILAVDIYDKGGLTKELNTQFCKIWFVAEGYMNFLLLAVIHFLMVMRVNALYGKRQKIAYTLHIAYALYFIATFSIVTPGMLQAVKTFYAENQFLHVCWGQLVDYFWITWVPALLLETFIFGLTAYKAWTYSREQMIVPVARTLYRDGFQYYIVILLCSLFPLLVWTEAPSTLDAMPKYAGMAIVNVMGFRLVLNLRHYSSEPADASTFESYEMAPSPSPRATEFPHRRHTRAMETGLPRFVGQCDSAWAASSAPDSCFDLSRAKSKEGDLELGVNEALPNTEGLCTQERLKSRPRVSLNLKLDAATTAASSQTELEGPTRSASPLKLDTKEC
ncbi:hypothetical protein RSOLAG1IB_06972 [Rhizoctonia solani AG-1 IB]|uniref:DUF6533 domain-containing protein n=1 Tax=Thanatephorus cucumeris (strain AG1-IB / isolate 7/3/14) TaxID=1108050 RepID=A0A0B7FDL8_THACB|nr:hypothetical protein RSOLAG1IB_06972 [Rhizoctonia solani AG-1 IB]